MIARREAVYNDNVFDSLMLDQPKQCWSIMRDVTKSIVFLRNQVWPGFYAYHRTNTPIFGSLYIGDGLQNVDLPFML